MYTSVYIYIQKPRGVKLYIYTHKDWKKNVRVDARSVHAGELLRAFTVSRQCWTSSCCRQCSKGRKQVGRGELLSNFPKKKRKNSLLQVLAFAFF